MESSATILVSDLRDLSSRELLLGVRDNLMLNNLSFDFYYIYAEIDGVWKCFKYTNSDRTSVFFFRLCTTKEIDENIFLFEFGNYHHIPGTEEVIPSSYKPSSPIY